MKIKRSKILIILVFLLILQGFFLFKAYNLKNRTNMEVSGVLDKIKSISELNTVEMYYNDIIDFSDAKYLNDVQIPFTKKQFIFTVKAKVKAGIDFSKLQVKDIDIKDSKTIYIKLPAAAITSKEILEYKPYDEKDGLFNEIKNEDTFNALNKFKEDLDKQSKDNGILIKAKENAKTSITQLLTGLGFEKVVVE
ncbi:MAG: DUF4230 domain-containing protein [Bacillota bacterium]|nr:DUF4230 domain-containing protein [Bacillota bacterium]